MTTPDKHFGLDLSVAEDGSKAVFHVIYPYNADGAPVSMDSVKLALDEAGVVSGIEWDMLEKAVDQIRTSGRPVRNIVAARAQVCEPGRVWIGNSSIPAKKEDIRKFWEAGKWIAQAYDVGIIDNPKGQVWFVTQGDTILRIMAALPCVDVYERPIFEPHVEGVADVQAGDGVCRQKEGEEVVFLAERHGYVGVTGDGVLQVFSPHLVSDDRMLLEFLLLPVVADPGKLVELLIGDMEKHWQQECPSLPAVDIRAYAMDCIHARRVERMILRRGRPPLAGNPGWVEWHIDLSGRPPADLGDERIDYATLSPYCEVQQSDALFTVHKPGIGIPGVDIDGQAIPAISGIEASCPQIGENVTSIDEVGRLQFLSAIHGMASIKNQRICVEEGMVIQGDVGLETGNLQFDGKVLVHGDIRAGYSVICQGLVVQGSIENGSKVRVKNTLVVRRGILGKSTSVLVQGCAEVGYIQACTLRVLGDLRVKDYIQDAKVTCRGTLTVEGRSVRGTRRGAVMGGHISALEHIVLHSAGTPLAYTSVTCGIDEVLLARQHDAERLLPLLTKRMMRLQSALGFDPTAPTSANHIAKLRNAERGQVRRILLNLKNAVATREQVEARIAELKTKATHPHLEAVSIDVQNHLVPLVRVCIGSCCQTVSELQNRVAYHLADDRVVSQTLAS